MKLFYKTILMMCIFIQFSLQQQVIGAFSDSQQQVIVAPNDSQQQMVGAPSGPSEKMVSDRMSRGTYVKGTVTSQSISFGKISQNESELLNFFLLDETTTPDDEFITDFLSYKLNLGYFFSFAKNHILVADIAYFRIGQSTWSIGKIESKEDAFKIKRREITINFQYKGSYEFSEKFGVLFGTHLSIWKFKSNKNNEPVVLYGSVLNPTSDQAAPVQLNPYFGIVLRPWSSGAFIAQMSWNHHLFQNESVAIETGDLTTTNYDVTIDGGQSGALKLKYKHDFGPLKLVASTEYSQVIIPRSAKYKHESLNSYKDINWNHLTFSGKASFNINNINENLSAQIWGDYGLGFLEWKEEGLLEKLEREGDHTFLSGGIGLVYNL